MLEISLVKPGLRTIAKFRPKFTYPIFGNEEQIFGYQHLKLRLKYHATDMRPHFQVSWGKKFDAVGDTEPTNVRILMEKVLPEGTLRKFRINCCTAANIFCLVAFQRVSQFEDAISQVPQTWVPPGKRIREFEAADGTKYEVWRGSLADPAVIQMINRIQILVPLFIEGGSFIGTDTDILHRWTVFFLYHKATIPGCGDDDYTYQFAGYSTVYRFILCGRPSALPPATDFELPTSQVSLWDLPSRSRISQFLILPPYQGKGNAGRLYSTIFDEYLRSPETVEITVEDPNEAFDDLRDLSDLRFLRTIPEFNDLRINASVVIPKRGPAPTNIVDLEALEVLRQKTKIAPRQFHRVVEIHLMSQLPDVVRPSIETKASSQRPTKAQEHEYRLWKLLVKQRLYRHNKELLGQIERDERIDKLGETLRSVEFEYVRLLAAYDRRSAFEGVAASAKGKRKLGEESEGPVSKKARTQDE